MQRSRIHWSLLAAAALGGCALTPESIHIQYSPAPGTAVLPAAAGVPVTVSVTDLRPDKSRVGTKRNARDVALAPIRAAEDVPATVQRAVETELRARGFGVPGAAGAVQVQLELASFMSRFKVFTVSAEAAADVAFVVRVPAAGGHGGYERRIAAEGLNTDLQLVTGERAREVLDQALREAIRQLFADPAFTAALLAGRPGATRAAL